MDLSPKYCAHQKDAKNTYPAEKRTGLAELRFVVLPEARNVAGHPVPHLYVDDVGVLGDYGLVVLKVLVELVWKSLYQVDCDSFDVRRSYVTHCESRTLGEFLGVHKAWGWMWHIQVFL